MSRLDELLKKAQGQGGGAATAATATATGAAATPKTGGGSLDALIAQAKAPKAPAAPAATPSYFYGKTPAGATFGAAEELDPSGRPFLGYRNPGDTSTTTDRTRVATTFDFRQAAPVTRDSFYNPRAVEDRSALREAMGAGYSDELDHRIALALSGSNDPANLKVIPGEDNAAFGRLEQQMQGRVIRGEISLLDAQIELARAKGFDIPWDPDAAKAEEPGWFDKTISAVGSAFRKGGAAVYKYGIEKPARFFDRADQSEIDAMVTDADGDGVYDADTWGIFWKTLPATFVEELPLGVGAAIKQIRDDPESARQITPGSLLASVPQAALGVAKGFAALPFKVAADVTGVAKTMLGGDGAVHWNVPGIGTVDNFVVQGVDDVVNRGLPPWFAATSRASLSVLDGLFLYGIAAAPFRPRAQVTSKTTTTAGDLASKRAAGKGSSADLPATGAEGAAIPTAPGPKSFRLYDANTAYTNAQTITPELKARMEAQGVDFGASFNIQYPVFFRLTRKPGGTYVGEVVQVKPSYWDTFVSKIRGDVTKVPPDQIVPVTGRRTANEAEIAAAFEKPVAGPIPGADVPPPAPPKAPGAILGLASASGATKSSTPNLDALVARVKGEAPAATDAPAAPLYHGTSKGTDFDQYDAGKAGSGVGSNIRNQGDYLYLTESKDAAGLFGKFAEQNRQLKDKTFDGTPSLDEGNVIEFRLRDGAKVKALDEMPMGEAEARGVIERAKADGYDAVSFPEAGLGTLEGMPEASALYRDGKPPRTTLVINAAAAERVRTPALPREQETARVVEELRSIYREAGSEIGESGLPVAEEALGELLVSLELAERGERIMTPDLKRGGYTFHAKRSTFPAWIPEKLRSRAAIDKLLSMVRSVDTISYPTAPNAVAQREFVDALLNQLDRELGVDTSPIRAKLRADGKAKPESQPQVEVPAGSRGAYRDRKAARDAARAEGDDVAFESAPTPEKPTVGRAGGKGASIGLYRDGTPVEAAHLREIKPIEMPELVEIARELTGSVPKVMRRMGEKLGYFKGKDKGEIALNAKLFSAENAEHVAKTLAHEIGHLVDYLPEGTLKRGNLIGSLLSLRDFTASTFGTVDSRFGAKGTPLDLKKMRGEATSQVIAEAGKTYSEYLKSPELRAELKPKIAARYQSMKDGSQAIQSAAIRRELLEVTRYWKPYDRAKSTPAYVAYRESARELYADAISVLFNSPGTLERLAPTFYREFFAALETKPAVRDAYFDLQARLTGDRQVVVEARRKGVRGMFEEGDYKAAELQKAREAEKRARERDYTFRFKFEMVDKNQALIDRVNALKKKGVNVPEDEDPRYYLEERTYMGGKQKAWLERHVQPVYKSLNEAGVSWTDFGEALFYRRIASGDRADVANPRGITPAAAKELLADMEARFTPAQRDALAQGIATFRAGVREVADAAFAEGLYKPEMYAQMVENPDYATFRVLDHLDDTVTAKVYRSIGTLKDVSNPADATVLKNMAVMRATENQRAKRATVDFLAQNFPDEVKPAATRWTGKSHEFLESKARNEELVVLYSKANPGTVEGYYVDPYIKASLDNESVGGKNLIVQTLKMANGYVFRPLFIGFNPGFQAFNLIRDFQRFWKAIPGMTIGRALRRYAEALPAAKARAFGPAGATQKAIDTILAMEDQRILSVTFNDVLFNESAEDMQINAILEGAGIGGFAEKAPPTSPLGKALAPIQKPIMAALDFIKRTGDLIESIPKVAGYYEFGGSADTPVSRENASFIRRKVGSPDFLAGGHIKPATNEIFLFSNAITQGIRADYELATQPRTRSGYWYKTAKVNLLPRLLMHLAALGFMGAAVKEVMDGATEYDKTNYIVIPLGIDENGKSVYIRVPQDETGRLISGLFWKTLNLSGNGQSAWKDAMDVASYTGGQVPGLNPILQTLTATGQYLSGQNPYDFFRNRNVLSDDVHKAGGAEGAKQFLGWVFNQNGGSIFYKFYSEPQIPVPKSDVEKVFSLPLVGSVLNRFVRVTNYGQVEVLRRAREAAEAIDAQRRQDERDLVVGYIERHQADGTPVNRLATEMVREYLGHDPNTKEEVATARRLRLKLEEGVKKGGGDPLVKALLDATSNTQKTAIVRAAREGMTDEEYRDFRERALADDLATAAVFNNAEKED